MAGVSIGFVSTAAFSFIRKTQAAPMTSETPAIVIMRYSASPQYNDAGNWLGLLFAVQAVGSVLWAVVLPRFRSRKFSYILSLLLGAAGFIMTAFFTNQWLLFVAFVLIGCLHRKKESEPVAGIIILGR